eukprot:TRINITY_DN3788_c0_g1_i2.p1 TRINITY_DN3788_c0_g1~~TRINITY_DN3788_c0_g1_i2.p1  ORF type:complete len:217 (+),score=25.86 TRINITY_DN3788_c0_g1_i2:613-1263(+)
MYNELSRHLQQLVAPDAAHFVEINLNETASIQRGREEVAKWAEDLLRMDRPYVAESVARLLAFFDLHLEKQEAKTDDTKVKIINERLREHVRRTPFGLECVTAYLSEFRTTTYKYASTVELDLSGVVDAFEPRIEFGDIKSGHKMNDRAKEQAKRNSQLILFAYGVTRGRTCHQVIYWLYASPEAKKADEDAQIDVPLPHGAAQCRVVLRTRPILF